MCWGRIFESGLTWLKNNGPCSNIRPCSNRRPGQEGVEKIADWSTICGNTVYAKLSALYFPNYHNTHNHSINFSASLFTCLRDFVHKIRRHVRDGGWQGTFLRFETKLCSASPAFCHLFVVRGAVLNNLYSHPFTLLPLPLFVSPNPTRHVSAVLTQRPFSR